MSEQARKHTLGLAGEFLVAGELLRRGISASITYGNAKRADVLAISESKTGAVVIEVKTTSSPKWVLGSRVPEPSADLWCLVYLPADLSQSPEYFILTSADLHNVLAPIDREYRRNFEARRNRPFEGRGVVSITRTQVARHESDWDVIVSRLKKGD